MATGTNYIYVPIVMTLDNAGNITNAITRIKTELKKMGGVADVTIGKVDKLKASLAKSAVTTKKVGTSLTHTTQKMIKYESELKKLYALQSRGYKITGTQLRQMKKMEVQYTKNVGATRKLKNTLQNSLKTFTKMRWMFVNLAMLAAALAAAWRVLGKPLVELETEMAIVQKRTKMSKEELHGLRSELIDISRTLPESAKELATLAGIAGQLGIRGTENIGNFVKVTAMMGTATVLTSEEAALALAKLSQAFDVPIKKAENMASAINELSNTTAANSKEISAAMLKMATSANQLGITSDMAAAIGASLVDMGMKAERAGTRMRAVFTRMASSTEEIAAFYGDGTLSSDIEKSISEDANGAFLTLIQTIATTKGETDRVKIATELFGRVGGSAVLALASNYLDLKKNIILASEEFALATSLQEEFTIQMSTTANQWKIMWGNIGSGWADFATSFGVDSAGMLKNYNDMTTAGREFKNVNKLIRQEMGGGIQDSTVGSKIDGFSKGSSTILGATPIGPLMQMMMRDDKVFKRIAKRNEDSFEDYVKTIKRKAKGMNRNTELTEAQEQEVKFYFTAETEGVEEAFKQFNIWKRAFKKEVDAETRVPLTTEQEQEAVVQLTKYWESFLEGGKREAAESLTDIEYYMESLGNVASETKDALSEQAEELAKSNLGYATASDGLVAITKQLEMYKEELQLIQQEYARTNDLATYTDEMARLNEHYADAIDYQTRLASVTGSTAAAMNLVAVAQKKAAFAYSTANKALSKQIQLDQDKYNNLKKARFSGDSEALANIHDIEIAIKRETLAQLGLKDAVEDTNDALGDGADSYSAWVDTVNQFITSALSSGNKLGKNVSGTISRFQSMLLSTSKFSSDKTEEDASTNELTELERLEEARTRAQLEYDLGIGENKYQLGLYISEVERGNIVELSSLSSAKQAISDNWDELERLKKQQSDMTDEYGLTQQAVTALELGISTDTITILENISLQRTEVQGLTADWLAAARAQSNGGGGSSGGGSSGGSSGGTNYTLSDGTHTNDYDAAVADAASGGSGTSEYTPYNPWTNPEPNQSFMNDFVMRPGASAVPFSQDDTIIGVKDTGALGTNVSIGNVTINGASGDPEDFAYKFTRELQRQLKTI